MAPAKGITLNTLRALKTGASVLSHNKAEVVLTAQDEQLGEIQGPMTSLASNGVCIAHDPEDPFKVVFVNLTQVVHAEVVW